MYSVGMNKDINEIIRKAVSQGWEVTKRSNGHFKFQPPAGRPLFFSGTPSDHRAMKNHLAKMKQLGFIK